MITKVTTIQTPQFLNKAVCLYGWAQNIRTHGKIIFIDLRDREGVVQVVFAGQELVEKAKVIKPEYVLKIEGIIQKRPKGTTNPNIPTGEIEIGVSSFEILSKAKTLPFTIHTEGYEIGENKRLKYRYLDLRRQRLKRNLIKRAEILLFVREFLYKKRFIEVETPILTKSTPEGARDFLVPSRLQPGKFYALPQSPQQYKQLLMVAGIEKYFQIARCFRDEDPRADRQAEFTQIDLEMSFAEQEEILQLIEEMIKEIINSKFPKKRIQKFPFPRLTYQEVITKYQTDKPDLRENKNDPNELAFAFVINFPMFEWSEEEKRWKSVHHPFTRPQEEDPQKIKKNPEKILAWQYDLVLNGYEIGGGSLRSYRPEILETVFEVLGHSKTEIKEKFGHLLEAFEYGVPPHGGIAIGFDRFLAILLNEPNIREVIAFPKTGDSRDLMMDAPSEVEDKQLKELGIQIIKQEKNENK